MTLLPVRAEVVELAGDPLRKSHRAERVDDHLLRA